MGEIASHRRFERLIDFLARIPAMEVDDSPSRGIGAGGANGV